MRLIDADALHREIDNIMRNTGERKLSRAVAHAMTENANTIDAVPVVHGHWIRVSPTDMDGNADWRCSNCHKGDNHAESVDVTYCWNCGARMDGGKE